MLVLKILVRAGNLYAKRCPNVGSGAFAFAFAYGSGTWTGAAAGFGFGIRPYGYTGLYVGT